MSITPVHNAPLAPDLFTNTGAVRAATQGADFVSLFANAIHETTETQVDAEKQVKAMLNGGEDLHSAMLSVEQASLSFELMLQVRNKVVNAYQEISRLQF